MVQLQATDASERNSKGNVLLGIGAVSSAAILSGFAGVYFEKIMKSVQTPIWILNLYMAVFGFIFSAIVSLFNDYGELSQKGFFYGWNIMIVILVLNQAVGGLIISYVVKLSNTIVKGFISALSLLSSTFFSIYFFGFTVSWWFAVGTIFVCSGIYIYQLPETSSSSSGIPATGGNQSLYSENISSTSPKQCDINSKSISNRKWINRSQEGGK